MKPLLLLDVDGVLCPIGEGPGGEMCERQAGEFPVRFSVNLPAMLRQLAPAFMVVWATSWGADANRYLSPLLGLGELAVIPMLARDFRIGETWKLPAIKRFVKDHPFAWLDDELGADAHRWADEREAPTEFIDIHPGWGLSAAHVAELLAFADTVPRRDQPNH